MEDFEDLRYYVFIINPIAGSGRGGRIFSKIQTSQLYQQLDKKSYLTKYKGHAEEIMKSIIKHDVEEVIGIVVIGGDGTLHEVANGLNNTDLPLSFIPGGSGNDFARGCSLEKNPLKALENIIGSNDHLPYYTGRFEIDDQKPRIFANSIGFGFDAMIVQTANESWYKKHLNKIRLGRLTYVIALIQVLFKFKPIDLEVIINKRRKQIFDCWMVTMTNHPYYGGGMKIIPESKIQADVFPVLIIQSISKWKMLFLFLTVFTGKHVNFKGVKIIEASDVQIKPSHQLDYQVDGEAGTCSFAHVSKRNETIKVTRTKK